MKILIVNNRLKVYGGEGTYCTSLGEELMSMGHDVQFFGLKDEDGIHNNSYNIYARKSKNPLRLIENRKNRKLFGQILDSFKPDLIQVNLLYFTLTPSILIEAKKRGITVIQTIHDGKMVCPSYQLFIKSKNQPCTLCVNGNFRNCLKHRCHKNSFLLSFIAYIESVHNRKRRYYDLIDLFVFPSEFMKNLHLQFGLDEKKTSVLCNFTRIEKMSMPAEKTSKYVLFFGRVIKIKGVETLAEAAKRLQDVRFVVVGDGDMIDAFSNMKNVQVVGFKKGDELRDIISKASCAVFPSVCYENCPMSIQESIALGTPVIGSRIGGIPELISEGITGFTFETGNVDDLVDKIGKIMNNSDVAERMSSNCISESSKIMNSRDYAQRFMEIATKCLR